MSSYQWLADDTRSSRRTIAHAVDVLCAQTDFARGDRATIQVGHIRLPSTESVGLIQILYASPLKTFIVALPPATKLKATRDQATISEAFDVTRFHEATVDVDGVVHLSDGLRLKAAEIRPHRLPLCPTQIDWRIVHATVRALRAEKKCYRPISYGLPKRLRRLIPRSEYSEFLDCMALRRLRVPTLKELGYRLREIHPFLRNVSDQKIATTLRTFGIRIPQSRPRRAIAGRSP